MLDFLKVIPQYCLPQRWLSQLIYTLTRIKTNLIKNVMIKVFIKIYQVDMDSAVETDPTAYENFNRFFTRAIKADRRPIADGLNHIVCPVDGMVSQYGRINQHSLVQAKGHQYSIEALLNYSPQQAATFANGQFATLYLSPRDYHRIHCPLDATLRKLTYIPGKLFSVNLATTRIIPQLFAKNERLVALFDTAMGQMVVVMVGAIFVSSLETPWTGLVNQTRQKEIRHWDYNSESDKAYQAYRGEEIGRFNMGSTVILLFQKDVIQWTAAMEINAILQMGQRIGDKI